MMNRRNASKILCTSGMWSTPIIFAISLPTHAQTSQLPRSVIGNWEIARVDGGTPIFMGASPDISEIEFLENGVYRINDFTSGEDLWSVNENGDFEYCIFTTKCNYGKITASENNKATEILITSGYTYISDVLLKRLD